MATPNSSNLPNLSGDFFNAGIGQYWSYLLGAAAGYYMMGLPGAIAGLAAGGILKEKGLDGIGEFVSKLTGGGHSPLTPQPA